MRMILDLCRDVRVIEVGMRARKGYNPLPSSHRLFGYKRAPRKEIPYKIWQRRSF